MGVQQIEFQSPTLYQEQQISENYKKVQSFTSKTKQNTIMTTFNNNACLAREWVTHPLSLMVIFIFCKTNIITQIKHIVKDGEDEVKSEIVEQKIKCTNKVSVGF